MPSMGVVTAVADQSAEVAKTIEDIFNLVPNHGTGRLVTRPIPMVFSSDDPEDKPFLDRFERADKNIAVKQADYDALKDRDASDPDLILAYQALGQAKKLRKNAETLAWGTVIVAHPKTGRLMAKIAPDSFQGKIVSALNVINRDHAARLDGDVITVRFDEAKHTVTFSRSRLKQSGPRIRVEASIENEKLDRELQAAMLATASLPTE
jgi:hypothetical protein